MGAQIEAYLTYVNRRRRRRWNLGWISKMWLDGFQVGAPNIREQQVRTWRLGNWVGICGLENYITEKLKMHITKQRHYFVNKGPSSQGCGFSSGFVWMWELDCEESWGPKNWWFWTVLLEKPLESPLDCKEIQPVHPKGYQSWIFTGRTDVEAETPVLWLPDAKSWLIWKDPDAGKDWRQEEKGMTEDEMVGWHHQLDGHEFEQTPGLLIDRKAWHASVRGITKNRTWLSDWTNW